MTRRILLLSVGLICAGLVLGHPAAAGQASAAPPAKAAQGPGGGTEAMVKEAKSRIREMTLERFKALKAAEEKLTLIDVREDGEWQAGRIPGAIHISRGTLEFKVEANVPKKDAKVVLYCRSGSRSALAADTLQKLGYTNVYSLAGGFSAYQKADLPVEK